MSPDEGAGRRALVTGATAGIGNAFARMFARNGFALVLVARDSVRLEALARTLREAHGIDVEVLPADLATVAGCSAVEQRLADRTAVVDVLVNNAGYGLGRALLDNPLAAEQEMFDVLTRAVLRCSHVAAGTMREHGHGTIINVSSVAGWFPHTSYGAAKSYVTALSQAMDRQLRADGVRVMALCPGFTRTEFHDRADLDMRRLPRFFWLDADALVEAAWRDLRRGRVVSVPGALYKVMRQVLRFHP